MTPLPFLAAAGKIANEAYSEFVPFQLDRSSSYLERRYANDASEFIPINNSRIHYRDEGNEDGPTIVTLHGTYSSLHTWDGWVEELKGDFRIVRLDMPGFGLTGPCGNGQNTLATLVDTVGDFCDELGLEDVILAGNSLGGGVAWRISNDKPGLASKLVLINAGGSTLLATLFSNRIAFGSDIVPRYFTPRMLIRLLLLDAYYDSSKVTNDLVRRYHDLLCGNGNRRAVLEISRNYMQDHYDEEVDHLAGTTGPALPSMRDPHPKGWDGYNMTNIDVPALFQWGSHDEWLPVSFGRELAEQTPNSHFITYDKVGHVAMEEAPERTAADAAAFITSSSTPPNPK